MPLRPQMLTVIIRIDFLVKQKGEAEAEEQRNELPGERADPARNHVHMGTGRAQPPLKLQILIQQRSQLTKGMGHEVCTIQYEW